MIKKLIELYQGHQILMAWRVPDEGLPLPRPVTDNRDLRAGDTFIAIKGANFDGHDFIDDAKQKAAALIIGERGAVQIQVTDSRKAAALYAKLFFGDPSAKMKLWGVTGTNGKTTSSLMLHQMLLKQGIKAAWIGTSGYKIIRQDFPTVHTTPDILQLNTIFRQMLDADVSHLVMEVSSHALALDRVYGVEFDYCLFTNLSRDHLDFHRDMDDYFETKYQLFENAAKRAAHSLINIDDPSGRIIHERLSQMGSKLLSIGRAEGANLRIQSPRTGLEGSSFELVSRLGESAQISGSLIGDFNIDNLALACAALYADGRSLAEIAGLSGGLTPVRGRIEPVANARGLGVYIDYAHSPDAISGVLSSLIKLPHQRIITVFGAGGDRDKGKRPLMLKAALRHSDAVIITDDNPRHENPEKIIYDIVKDTDSVLPWWIIRDRAEAIRAAIRLARPGDIVAICGKGHETYQEIRGVRHEFDDHQVAEAALRGDFSQKADDELILPVDPLLLRILNHEEPQDGPYSPAKSHHYISTDSRAIKRGSVFFAIKGENFDGNRFIPQILEDGSNLAVGDCFDLKNDRLIQNPKAELLMASLLKKYIQLFPIYKIALTGSTGKTSAKEILAQILAENAPTLKTQRNENNIIGLCKTILRVRPEHKYGVFEIGTNHFGEIAHLADTLTPDAGIILNIGPSHLKYFKDEEGVFREKSELFHRALGQRLFPADDSRFEAYKNRGKSVGFAKDADYFVHRVESAEDRQFFSLGPESWRIPYGAPHYVINSAFCIAMALELGLAPQEIQAALDRELSIDMRMQIEKRDKRHIIVDCYNANPISMQSAIEYWRDYRPGLPHLAFLGDMLELGDKSELYHQMIGAILLESGDHTVYSVGNHARSYQNTDTRHFMDASELLADFPSLPEEAVILVKASNGIHLEKILPKLRGEI